MNEISRRESAFKTLKEVDGVLFEKNNLLWRNRGQEIFLCEKFEVLGVATKANGARVGILCSQINDDGHEKSFVVPFDALREVNKLAQKLTAHGLTVPLENTALKAIAKYIHTIGHLDSIIVLTEEGVHRIEQSGHVFDVVVIGDKAVTNAEAKIHIALERASIYASRGTVEDWKSAAEKIFQHNPIVIGTACAAASALTHALFGLPTSSVHLAGPSSSGKTSLLQFIHSMYCAPRDPHGWSNTANGSEALAIRYRDAPFTIDELGEGSASSVLEVIYRINNGVGKVRANSEGSARESTEIRTVMISCGEISLQTHAKTGRQVLRHGHEVRMPTITLDEEHGCFTDLNDFDSAASLAESMKSVAANTYGAFWLRWAEGLLRNHEKCADFIEKKKEKYRRRIAGVDDLSTLSAVEGRVLAAFLSWAISGELAIRLRLLPLQKDAAVKAAFHLYAKWLTRWRAVAGAPAKAVLEPIQDFFQRQAPSMFVDLKDWQSHQRREIAGYLFTSRRHGDLYLVHRGFFENVLCKEQDPNAALAALDREGLLVRETGGKTYLQRMPGSSECGSDNRIRFYAIKRAIRFDS